MAQTDYAKQVNTAGMTFSWVEKSGYLYVKLSSPKKGWVAVGFNNKDNLPGASLIMGTVLASGEVRVVDHYIRGMGDYLPVTDLGVKSAVSQFSGFEGVSGTSIFFRIPIIKKSRYHQTLIPGSSTYVILAYSLDDDFQHHSIHRSAQRLRLF